MAKAEDPKQPSKKYLSVTQVQGTRLRGRPVNTWNEILRKDMVDCGVTEDMCKNNSQSQPREILVMVVAVVMMM